MEKAWQRSGTNISTFDTYLCNVSKCKTLDVSTTPPILQGMCMTAFQSTTHAIPDNIGSLYANISGSFILPLSYGTGT